MTKKAKSASAESVQVRPKYGDYQGVTICMLSRPGHGIPCDQDGCDRDAVWAMGKLGGYHPRRSVAPGAKVHVRCELHLNYTDGAP